MPIRIVLADDHVVFRQALGALLEDEPDLEIVGEASNGREAIDLVRRLQPQVVLMDAVIPELDGLNAAYVVHDELPEVRVVFLSGMDEEATVVAAVRAGAFGYLSKTQPIDVVVRAIRGAAAGEVQFSRAAETLLVHALNGPAEQVEPLTRRELEVLENVAEGLANKEIAWKLGISEKTVKSHVSTILDKFGLASRTQAAMYATRVGLVSDAPGGGLRSPVYVPVKNSNIIDFERRRRGGSGLPAARSPHSPPANPQRGPVTATPAASMDTRVRAV